MNLKEEIIKYLDAGYPILFINSYEEKKTDEIIKRAVGNRKVIEWNGATGFSDFDSRYKNVGPSSELWERFGNQGAKTFNYIH